METLELKKYAAVSKEYNEMEWKNTDESNAFYNEKMKPYWDHFDECDVRLTTVIFSHVNDMVHICGDSHKRMRAEFVKWLLFRYPNTENVSILAHAEFAEFLKENPRFDK